MAKKRLNRKVALIGSAIFVVVVVIVIAVILRFSQDPTKFIIDGDAALKVARETTEGDARTEEYERAERNYQKAHGLAKTDSLRGKMLFKLADVYRETDQWRKVQQCWNGVIRIDPKNVEARFARLKYFYIMADSGLRRAWQEVASQASELIEVAEERELLTEDTAQWDPFGTQEETGRERMGPYLYLVRGRAVLEITRMGISTDQDESLTRAINDLKKVQELEPNNVDAPLYLAVAALSKGRIHALRGEFEERDKAEEQSEKLLEQAAEIAGPDPRAHINLLSMKVMRAQRSGDAQMEEQILSLEPDYVSLVKKFPSSPEALSALASFYRLSLKNLDKAIEAAEKAVELDKEDVAYAINAAKLHYSKFCIYGQKPEFYKTIEMAKSALTLPDAQDKPGPRHWANLMNRVALYVFLTECYIEQVIEPCKPTTEQEKQKWLTEAEQAVHQVQQLLGTGDAPQVVKWQGLLELAKGNRSSAVKKMYTAYEQLKSVDQKDSLLSYRLAKVFENTAEIGAVLEFFASALRRPGRINEKKPEALLDYANVLLKLGDYSGALSVANFFEKKYWTNERSKRMRMDAYVGGGQFEEVEKELAKGNPDDPNTIKPHLALVEARIRQIQRALAQEQLKESSPIILRELEAPKEEAVGSEGSMQLMRVELNGYWADLTELVEKLLLTEPNSVAVASVAAVCNNYIADGKTSDAKVLVNKFLEYFPDNTAVLFYQEMLSEPEPGNVSQQRRKEIEEHVLSNVADPNRRAIGLGRFYHRHNELKSAAVEFRKVFKIEALQEGVEELALWQTKEAAALQRLAATHLFEIAIATKDWKLAEQIAETGRRGNLDDCEGQFFAARLAVAKNQYIDALARLDECLKLRPVFSRGLLLRSNVNAALGNELSSVEDAQKAASLNPLDGTIAKGLASVLYRRDQKLGDNVSSDQITETKSALVRALRANPRDSWLLSFYAEYISSTEPSEALAIRQHLQKAAPSVENALLLGKMAMKIAPGEPNAEKKSAYFDIAASSFEWARTVDPQNKAVLEAQAEYYRATGQDEKAKQLLQKAEDRRLLWAHYFRIGEFENANRVLEQLYKSDPNDSSAVKGLLLIAERTADQEAVKEYSEELLLLSRKKLTAEGIGDAEKSIIKNELVENHLLQIQTFLKTGLVKEAELKLESFKEQYSDEPRTLLLEAWLAMRQGRLQKALQLTNRNLETNQENAMAWRIRGEIYFLMADYGQAIDDLKRSKVLLPEPVARFYLAKAYLQADRAEEAITELKNLIDRPQVSMEQAPLGRGPRELLEHVYIRSGRREALRRFYAETTKKFPDDVRWHKRAGTFAIAEAEFDKAERLYGLAWQESKKNGKGDITALDGYLQALVLGAGTPNTINVVWDPTKLDKVFEEGRKYVDSDFAPIAYLRMAEAKMKLGDKPTAVEYCRKALDKAFAGTNENLVAGILQRTDSLLGNEEGSKYCRQKLETNPDSLGVNWAMFNVMKAKGEYNKAVDYIDKCLKIPGTASSRRLTYISEKVKVLELAYYKTSDNNYLKRAIAEYESLLAKMPNNTIVLNNLAYMLAENDERLPQALKYAERAYEAMPNNAGFLDTYAYVLHKNGRNLEADAFLQAALQQYGQNRIAAPADVYEHLGMIKEALGAAPEALNAYEQALEIGVDALSKPAKERLRAAVERLSRQDELRTESQ
jgi:tetratricopeptide (TPR) repeat protein